MPVDWAACDGALLSIEDNAALYSLLGIVFGGDGLTTFALPNLEGSVPIQSGQGPGLSDYVVGQSGGSETVSLIVSETPLHSHSLMASNQPGLSFTYTNRTLVRQQGTLSKTLLTGCDSLQFSIYQRSPIPGTYDQYAVAETTNCKVVMVTWLCSRKILGSKLTTESQQTAKIVMRKH